MNLKPKIFGLKDEWRWEEMEFEELGGDKNIKFYLIRAIDIEKLLWKELRSS